MAEIKVEGRVPLSVPEHLDGLVAAGDTARLRGHAWDAAVVLGALALAGVFLAWSATGQVPVWLLVAALALSAIVVLVHTVTSLIGLSTVGQTFGMKVARVRWVDISTATPMASKSLMKFAVEMLCAIPTLGILPALIGLFSQGEMNRTWFDRLFGTLAVRVDERGELERFVTTRRAHLVGDEAEAAADRARPPMRRYVLNDTLGVEESEEETLPMVSQPPSLPLESDMLEEAWEPGAPLEQVDLASLSRVGRASGETKRTLSDYDSQSELEKSVGVRPTGAIRLVFDDGTRYDLVDTLLVGRAPVAAGRWAQASTYSISDPERAISKTHLALSVRDGQLHVTDLDSVNGTRLSAPTGEERKLTPGTPEVAAPGSFIIFGNRLIVVGG
ncbi:MAG: FHA domain-containing protein [Actinomycetaceae bacterium]|nr:FHA domain-containing protein [Actinomycetaceae bacterium]